LEDLARHEQQIDKEANAYDIAEARDMRRALEEWRHDSLAKVQKAEQEQTARQLEAICSWMNSNGADQSLIFDRISTEGSNHPGTCSWLLENPKLSKWLRADHSDITCIWLQGNPGTGKSIISGQLVSFLNASHKSFVTCHFCTYSYASSTQYDEILKSLLLQLVRASSDLAAHIYEGYVIGRKPVSMSVLEHLLQTAITVLAEDLGRQQSIHMIIDGLDEMETDKQRRLISVLNGILKSQSLDRATLKVLFSSRRSQSLDNGLRKRPAIVLGDEKDSLEHAICTYAEQRLKAQSYRFSQLALKDSDFIDIGKSIAKKADGTYSALGQELADLAIGMFLWARLVLDYITHNMFYSSQEIWDAIHTLPRKLAEL
jgi:peptidyl-tRNA hydrolase